MGVKQEYNILAVYSLWSKAGRDIFSGMLEAMSGKADYHLFVRQPGTDFSAKDVLGENGTTYDGFIVTMPGSQAAMKALVHSRKPTVLVNITNRELAARADNISFVWGDGSVIGCSGAEHLLECGTYKSAGYVHELKYEFYSYEREIAFRARMKKASYNSLAFPSDNDFSNYLERLRAWLRDLPKPAAIMAVSDMRAADIINICKSEGYNVPEQVAVIGVDDDIAQHEKCGIGISSIQPDFHKMGQIAMQELDFLFRHPKRKRRPHEILVPIAKVIPRESSVRSSSAAKLVQRALAFIHANSQSPIRRTDVAAHLGCSIQLAELRFRQIVGKTIRTVIEETRMNEVNRRLRQENFSVRETAMELGFASANQLTRIYRRHFGHTITEAHSTTLSTLCITAQSPRTPPPAPPSTRSS